ncbi:MAG: hypothetical protein AVDCRST_MAG45-2564, partial [uncultured Solirubrobacterales bacterium]
QRLDRADGHAVGGAAPRQRRAADARGTAGLERAHPALGRGPRVRGGGAGGGRLSLGAAGRRAGGGAGTRALAGRARPRGGGRGERRRAGLGDERGRALERRDRRNGRDLGDERRRSLDGERDAVGRRDRLGGLGDRARHGHRDGDSV